MFQVTWIILIKWGYLNNKDVKKKKLKSIKFPAKTSRIKSRINCIKLKRYLKRFTVFLSKKIYIEKVWRKGRDFFLKMII